MKKRGPRKFLGITGYRASVHSYTQHSNLLQFRTLAKCREMPKSAKPAFLPEKCLSEAKLCTALFAKTKFLIKTKDTHTHTPKKKNPKTFQAHPVRKQQSSTVLSLAGTRMCLDSTRLCNGPSHRGRDSIALSQGWPAAN